VSSLASRSIPLFKVFMPPEEELLPRLREILYSGFISEGEPVYEFERQFGEYIGSPNVLSFYSGTAALHSALFLAGVRPGDEVITTAMTAEPTNLAILHAGGTVVWADVDPCNGNISPASVESCITAQTKAIVAVHYAGIPVCLDALSVIAQTHNLPIIEDAAHALGGRYAGKPLGSHSAFVMFSLQAIKHMTTVDGGMLVCRNPDSLSKGRTFRWFGIDRQADRTEVDVKTVGYKYHMNNVNATIGLAQLEHVRSVVDRYVENGRYFDRELRGVDGIELCHWDDQAEPAYWMYTVLAERRDELSRHLTAHGVGNSQCHKRNDWHSVFSESRCDLPGLDLFYARMLHIPCGWWVSNEDREYIVQVLREGW
jgi:perosamine synthetase